MKTERTSEKFVYRLEEVSRITQIDPKTIDTWEKEFPFLLAGETAGGKKIFRKKDLDIILRIKELLITEGLTLAGAKRKIEKEFGLQGNEPLHPDRLKKTLYQVRNQLQEIAESLEKKGPKKL